jgi:hypothetical protein
VAAAVFAGSAVGHLLWTREMASSAAWAHSPWYQREIALFDVAHALGLGTVAWRREADPLHLGVVSLTALLLGLNHAAAIRAGDSGGMLNWSAAVGNTTAGLFGLALAAHRRA